LRAWNYSVDLKMLIQTYFGMIKMIIGLVFNLKEYFLEEGVCR